MPRQTPQRGPIYTPPTIGNRAAAVGHGLRVVAVRLARFVGSGLALLSMGIIIAAVVAWSLLPIVGAAMGTEDAGQVHPPLWFDVGVAVTLAVAMVIRVMIGVVEGFVGEQPEPTSIAAPSEPSSTEFRR